MVTSAAPTASRSKLDVWGLIAVILAAAALLPALAVFLIGLVPEMNAIWWLGIVIIPLAGIAGVIVVALSIVGVVVGVRRGSRYVLSIIGLVLGAVLIVPIAALYLGSL